MTEKNRIRTFYPSSGDKMFEDLRYEGKFLEAFTYAWGMVESDIDNMIVFQFGFITGKREELHPKTGHPKVKYLLKLSFHVKIEFLKEIKRFDTNAFNCLKKFSEKRNELFHGDNYRNRFLQLTDVEKNQLLDLASKALRVSMGFNNQNIR